MEPFIILAGLVVLGLVWAILSLLAAGLSNSKGNGILLSLILSLFLTPVISLLVAMLQAPNAPALEQRRLKEGELRACPFCRGTISADALVCQHCQRGFY